MHAPLRPRLAVVTMADAEPLTADELATVDQVLAMAGDWNSPDLMVRAVRHYRAEVRRLRAELADAKTQRAEDLETIRMLGDTYREAVGVPPSEHQARRLEDMAQRLETAQAELADANSREQQVRAQVRTLADRHEPGCGSVISAWHCNCRFGDIRAVVNRPADAEGRAGDTTQESP